MDKEPPRQPHLRAIPSELSADTAEQPGNDLLTTTLRRLGHVLQHTQPAETTIERGLRMNKRWVADKPLNYDDEFVAACLVEAFSNDGRKSSQLRHPASAFSEKYAMVYRRTSEKEIIAEYRIQLGAKHPVLLYEGAEFLPIHPETEPHQWRQFAELIDELEQED